MAGTTPPETSLFRTLMAVRDERYRQDEIYPDQVPASPWRGEHSPMEILAEEVGEVARNIMEDGEGGEEWIHVAAVAVKMWQIEQMERGAKGEAKGSARGVPDA